MMTISFDRVHAVKQKSDYTKDINVVVSRPGKKCAVETET